MNLYVFNPDNDLALANNDANYRAPASARKMSLDLTPLTGWLAADGDMLLFPEITTWEPASELYPRLNSCFMPQLTEEFEKDKKRRLNLKNRPDFRQPPATVFTGKTAPAGDIPPRFANTITQTLYNKEQLLMPQAVIPWGWNPGLICRLINAGISRLLLPDSRAMENITRVSHRSLAVRVLRRIKEEASTGLRPLLCGDSREVFREEDLCRLIETPPGEVLLKAPLSGSGRGLIRGMGRYAPPVSGWCKNTLETQGCVIAEPYYNKVCDFAMEFMARAGGHVTFKGYSLFETNTHGSYTRNILLTNNDIVSTLCRYEGLQKDDLEEIQELLRYNLEEETAGRYTGCLGVDMMICRDEEGHFRLHPCVEVNARFTMGLFSRLFYDRYVVPGTTGTFHIRFSKKEGELQDYVQKAVERNPLRIKNNRFVSGYSALTPVNKTSRFLAEINLQPTTADTLHTVRSSAGFMR